MFVRAILMSKVRGENFVAGAESGKLAPGPSEGSAASVTPRLTSLHWARSLPACVWPLSQGTRCDVMRLSSSEHRVATGPPWPVEDVSTASASSPCWIWACRPTHAPLLTWSQTRAVTIVVVPRFLFDRKGTTTIHSEGRNYPNSHHLLLFNRLI